MDHLKPTLPLQGMSTSTECYHAVNCNKFEYAPLLQPIKQFRLLSFETSSSETDLSCRLQSFDLTDCPEYYALSYVYGDPSIRESILINGKEGDVNKHGWRTLHQARAQASTGSYFWLDAICINQNDHQEKAIQVSKIAQIFTSAVEAWMCFGPEQDDSDFLFQTLQSFLLRSYAHPAAATPTEKSDELQRRTVSWLVSLGEEFDRFANALKAFGRRPFFSRVWIYQELYLATKVVMICGTATTDMVALKDIVKACTSLDMCHRLLRDNDYKRASIRLTDMLEKAGIFSKKPDDDLNRLSMMVYRIRRDRGTLHYMERHMLFSIQDEIQDLLCHDPRDKIFAVISVLGPGYDITPDYSISCYELASQVLARHGCKGTDSKSQWPMRFAAILCRNLYLDLHATEAKLAMAMNLSRKYDSTLPARLPSGKLLWYATAFGCQVNRTSTGQMTAPIFIKERESSIESNVPLVEDRVSDLFVSTAKALLTVEDRVVAISACELDEGDWIVPLTDYVTDLGNDTYCYGMILRAWEPGLYRLIGEIAFHPFCRPCSASSREPDLCRCTLEPQVHADIRTSFDIIFDSEELLLFSTRLRAPFDTMRQVSRYRARGAPLLPFGPPMKWHSSLAVEYLEDPEGGLRTPFTG
jgi:hypothetical protein